MRARVLVIFFSVEWTRDRSAGFWELISWHLYSHAGSWAGQDLSLYVNTIYLTTPWRRIHAVATAAIKLENVFKSSVWFVFFLSLSVVFSDQDPLWSVDGCSLSVHLNPCQSELMSDSSASANFPVQWIPFFSKGVPLPLPENRWIMALDQERPKLDSFYPTEAL